MQEWVIKLKEIERLMFDLGADMEYHGGFGTNGETGRLLVLASRDISLLARYIEKAGECDSGESI